MGTPTFFAARLPERECSQRFRKMPTRLHITLSEVVQVAGSPLKENSLWALLRLASEAVQVASAAGEGPGLLITPESILLRPGGQLEVLDGIYDDGHSQFVAPESRLGWKLDKDKVYVYSLGASLGTAAAVDSTESGSLQHLLRAMVAKEPYARPSLHEVLQWCAHVQPEKAMDEVNELVSLVLGKSEYTSSEDEADVCEENLDRELNSALLMVPSSQRGSVSSLTEGSTQLLKRRPSSRSVGAISLARLTVSSVPPTYHLSLQEGLNASSPHILHRAVSLNLHSQDIHLLASKTKRHLPHDHPSQPTSTDAQRTESFSEAIDGIAPESSSPPSPPDSPPPSERAPPHSVEPSPPHSVEPSPPHSVEPSPPHSVEPSPPHSVEPSPPHSVEPSPPHSVEPSPPPSVEPSPPSSVEPSPPPSVEPSPPPSVEPSPPPSVEPSPPPSVEPSPPPSVEPSPPPSPPASPPPDTKHDVIYPEDASSPLSNAFTFNSLPDDLPPLHPSPTLPTSVAIDFCDDPQPALASTVTTLEKIDSVLLDKGEVTGNMSLPSRSQGNDTMASFDYSDLENSNFNHTTSSAVSSGGEFEFPRPLPPLPIDHEEDAESLETHRAVDEALHLMDTSNWETENNGEKSKVENAEDEVKALYATVDKSKKTSRRIRTMDQSEQSDETSSETSSMRSPVEPERASPSPDVAPLHLPEPEEYRPASGVYEEVEAHSAQVARVDSRGYTEVGKGRVFLPVLEVGYTGTGSINKLRTVLGPEFSSMTGGKVRGVSVPVIPHGRRAVEVVLLNGKEVKFVVDVSATTSQLFGQVISSQSLQETQFFGLAVRIDRDEVFLDMGSKLAKHAPPGWITSHASFTLFFRVKYYVENVSQLVQPLTRHLYYLQLRKDTMEGRMFCHEDHALQLAALAVQAERGSTTSLGRTEDYVPAQVLEKLGRESVENLLSSMHRERFGLTRMEAEQEFLKEAQKLPEYGMLFYRVAKGKHEEPGSVWLGFCVRGVVVFDVHKDVKTAIHHCAWRKTNNISYAHRKFVIELQDKPEPLVFYASTYKRARYLLELSKACHKFHLVWAKKSHKQMREKLSFSSAANSVPSLERSTSTNVVVEYPSPSRPSSVVEDIRTPPSLSLPLDPVRVLMDRGSTENFGFSLAGSTQSSDVYVVKVAAGSVSEGQLLVGDRVMAINNTAVKSYRQTLTILRDCGPQVAIDVQRRGARDLSLPTGESVTVQVCKEAGVLGVRIAGGSDKPYGRGLVRIKQVTADTAGSRSGALLEGDIILQVNSVSLKGMTHQQAADVIVNASDTVTLQLHRPFDPYWWRASPTHSLTSYVSSPSHSLPSPTKRTPSPLPPLPPIPPHPLTEDTLEVESCPKQSSPEHDLLTGLEDSVTVYSSQPHFQDTGPHTSEPGEHAIFDVTLRKGQRGFGFRLDKAKSGKKGCGVFILAIDDCPAKGNGKLEPGDEIISVNGDSIVGRTHHECLQVLRAVSGAGTLTVHRTPHTRDMQPLPQNQTDDLDCSTAPSPPSSSPPLTDEPD